MGAQVFKDISLDQFISTVESYKERGWRFANLCGSTVGDKVELLCSFALGEELENLSMLVGIDDRVPAVSPLFPSAFLNENETSELFGVKFEGMILDFGGRFYPTSVPTPMNPTSREAQEYLATHGNRDKGDDSNCPNLDEGAGEEVSHG